MSIEPTSHYAMSRRRMLSGGLGSVALASLLGEDLLAREFRHFAPRARQVIYLHMVGAPSHLDLFEPKAELRRYHGDYLPDHLHKEGQQFAFIRGRPRLLASPYVFHKRGESGLPFSELLPHLGSVADDLTVIRTLYTKEFNHAPAQLYMLTGFGRLGRPSVGSWVSYGLGSHNRNLPAFVVLNSGGNLAGAGSSLWNNGFLPGSHQGIEFRSKGDPVLFLKNPKHVDRSARRRELDTLRDLNQGRHDLFGDPEILTRINQYELAFRMQTALPDLVDISTEPESVHRLYGRSREPGSFANHCLLARRLVERGVRFVQLFNIGWDHHAGLYQNLPRKAEEIDQPVAGLIRDLKARGLFESTLIVWSAEFGRTPVLQSTSNSGIPDNVGRDHHKDCFTVFMAGGGLRGGTSFGTTDELGFLPAENPVHVNDYHATLLHLLGIDHKRLTFRYQGRDFRLTDVGGRVVREIIS